MAVSNLRNRDMSVEREIAMFLDMYLYSDERFTQKERTDSIEAQMDGSDIIISIPSLNLQSIVVDEKAQTQYVNRPLPTFSLELSFLSSSNQLVEGWLIDMNKRTEYYLFQWIHRADKDWNIKTHDIRKLEYALVSRKKILDYLESYGYSIDRLKVLDSEIRSTGSFGAHYKTPDKKFYFFFSTQLAEKPINVILRKEVIINLSEMKGIIEV